MKIIADTNVLVRALVRDDERQARAATDALKAAEAIVIPTVSFCELVWVLRRYKFDRNAIVAAVTSLVEAENAIIDRPKIEAGLEVQEAGGDFADGVIAHEGTSLGGDTFVSFDKRAVALIAQRGQKAQWLGAQGRASS